MMKKVYISPNISVIEAETVMPLAAGSNTPPSGWDIDGGPSFGGDSGSNTDEFDPRTKEDGGSLWD